MNGQVKQGDVVVFRPEWQDPGDKNITFRALEDEDGGRVLVVAEVDLPIRPTQVVSLDMIAEVRRDRLTLEIQRLNTASPSGSGNA